MTLKIGKNQMSLRYNGDKYIAVKSQSSDCNNCAFFCCELEDEKQETFCNPSNRTDGQFVIWVRHIKSENGMSEIDVNQAIESFKKLKGATAKDVSQNTGIDHRPLRKIITYLKKTNLIKIGNKYYWMGI